MRFVVVAGIVLAGSTAVGSGRAEAQHYGGYGEVVRCESRDYRQHYCDIDARGGVDIVNQLSDTACVEGRTWGWDRRGVWVSGGCRGEFASGGRGGGYDGGGHGGGYGHGGSSGGYGDVIRCESRSYAQVYCDAETRRGVRLVNQLSSTACVEGQTWGADRRGVWVRGGCRGEFEVGAGGGGGYGYDGGRPGYGGGGQNTIVCESRDNRYRHCSINVYREAELVRQLSDNHCVFNRSWGYDRNGVWVDRGCRGEFVVY